METFKIGFTTEYYTLWRIEEEIRYDFAFRPYRNVRCTYIQNLAKDLYTAQKNAKKICKSKKNLDVDMELKGNRYFDFQEQLYCDLPDALSPFYEFGKWYGYAIHKTNAVSLDYMNWYYEKTQNRYCKQILIAAGYVLINDHLYSPEAAPRIVEKIAEKHLGKGVIMELCTSKEFTFYCEKNLTEAMPDEDYNNVPFAYLYIDYKQISIMLIFEQYNNYSYKGYGYALPVDNNGYAKKIKNKDLQVHIEPHSVFIPSKDDYQPYLMYAKVSKFSIL